MVEKFVIKFINNIMLWGFLIFIVALFYPYFKGDFVHFEATMLTMIVLAFCTSLLKAYDAVNKGK